MTADVGRTRGSPWHGITYRYIRSRRRHLIWRCQCGVQGQDRSIARAEDAVIRHMEAATAKMREGRPVGLRSVNPSLNTSWEASLRGQ